MRRFVRTAVALAIAAGVLVCGPVSAQNPTALVPVVWQGELWAARESGPVAQAPSTSHWLATPDTVWVDDQGYLHLAGRRIAGQWYSAGVNTIKDNYGYGTYRFIVESPLANFDPQTVIGMFTYNQQPADGHQEIDVELSRWGQPSPTATNTQFVIQPWRVAANLHRFASPSDRPLTYEWKWAPTGVVFKVRDGIGASAPVIRKWRAVATPVPTQGTQVYLNLWYQHGEAPYGQADQEVVFRSFTYTPAK